MLELDAVLFEQVLFNLLDNAAKYAPPGTTIRVQGWQEGDSVMLQSSTKAPAFPPTTSSASSTSFYRAQKGDQVRAGTGLGLAICARLRRGAWAARSSAANRADRSRRGLHHHAARSGADAERLDTAA